MTQLKRTISLPLLTFYGIGTILGAGIYVLIGKVALFANHYTPLAFLLAAFVASFTGLTFCELCSRFPKSGGEATYVFNAFRSHPLAALVGWMIVTTGVVSAATITRGVVGYLDFFLPLPDAPIIIIVIAVLTLLAIWGIKESLWVAAAITLVEIGGLLLVIISAKPNLHMLQTNWHTLLPPLQPQIWPGIFSGAFLAFYAFIGFEDMVNVAEEVIEPERTLPRGIIISIVLTTILYLIVAFIAISSLSIDELTHSKAPMSDLFAKNGGSAKMMALISMIAVTNGALIQIIMASRVIYGMAMQGSSPRWLAHIYPRTQTPLVSTIIVSILILFFALTLPLTQLAQITSFIILSVFTLMNLSLVKVKLTSPQEKTYIRLPMLIPLIGAITCLLLIGMQVVSLL